MNDKDRKSSAESAMDFLAGMDEMLDMLDGYRAKLVARGYTDNAAERMTVRMHDLMLKNIEVQL